jgi:hypothetical protein
MKYDLARLGSDNFESLVSVLAKETIGKQPTDFRFGVYGGREGSFRSDIITWPANLGSEVWTGVSVANIRFRDHTADVPAGTRWFMERTQEYLSSWQNAKYRNTGRRVNTSYTLFVTNAELLETGGGLDSINQMIAEYSKTVKMKGWKIWHYRTICNLLDNSLSARKSFSGFIIPDNGILSLSNYRLGVSPTLGDAIKRQVVTELTADQWVRLSQVGNTPHDKLSLSNVGIDLPLISENRNAVQYILDIGDQVHGRDYASPSPHTLLIGGPGQGKTTLGQLVCQAYRSALLPITSDLGNETSRLLRSHRDGLHRIGIRLPSYHRWPIRIDLGSYGDAASSADQTSLLKYMAQKIGARTNTKIDASHLRNWLQIWPWLLVLDGLDEVASSTSRDILMDQIHNFTVDAEMVKADVFIIATTRPQGYSGEFREDQYRRVSLAPLSSEQAISYAEILAEVRHSNDPEMREKVTERTRIAASEPFTARLMQTPLQVTIMAILLEARERAPQARYALFDAYYETIYSREISKPGPLAKLLESRKNDINALHDRIGLLLQAQSQKTGEADASISRSVLRRLSVDRLLSEGYLDAEAQQLADSIVTAVTQRLVLIVPKALDDIGFEVRSVQEFMAGRAMVSGRDNLVLERLRETIPSIHWRNTWLFAAGRVFSQREHMRRDLIGILEEADTTNLLRMVVAPGADLALDMLDDDLAAATPSLQRVLARNALTLLDYPPDQDLIRRADVIFRLANKDDFVKAACEQVIEQSLNGSPTQQKSAEALLHVWKNRTGTLAYYARQLINRLELSAKVSATQLTGGMTGKTIGDLVRSHEKYSALPEDERRLSDALIEKLDDVKVLPNGASIESATKLVTSPALGLSLLGIYLSEPAITELLAACVISSAKDGWSGAAELRNLLRSWLQRREVADEILAITPFPQEY